MANSQQISGRTSGPNLYFFQLLLCFLLLQQSAAVQCNWPPEDEDLQVQCICGSGGNSRFTVQCSSVDLKTLIAALQTQPPLDLLALVNGSVSLLEDGSFSGLDVRSVQLTNVKLQSVSGLAFQGLERTLTSLNLEHNELREVPSSALRRLNQLRELDLSRNRITELPEAAFSGIPLTTLKLADNPLHISNGAFRGLESTLHNLNLKGTGQEKLPPALEILSELSFLDLAQNKISDLAPNSFASLGQLTALTLERNMISHVDNDAFAGLNITLSSLSLLNNKIEVYPAKAIRFLTQLRVLDIGFNRIREIPEDAFVGNSLLSLLALDGNPLSTVSEDAFSRLNSTLRGLSIGGSTLVCDCRLRWILQWVKQYALQVTSRERSPQFCGRPLQLRRRSLPQLSPNELKCEDGSYSSTTPSTISTTIQSTTKTTVSSRTTQSGVRDLRAPRTALGQLRLLEVSREGENITVKWDSIGESLRSRTAPPVHAMYRVFGEPHFHLGASVSPMLGWVRIKVPSSKPIVVCVVESAQAATLSPESVPHSQCHEVLPDKVTDSQLNKIIIGSSAAVCGMIILAVIIFVCCSRRTTRRDPLPRPTLKSEHEWENASLYSGRSIPRARTYHGSVNPNFLHEPRTPDDVQSFRSLPATRMPRGPVLSNKELHNSHIALSQLSGHHSFLGAYDNHNGWNNHHWENGDVFSDSRHPPSRLSYAKDSNFG